VPSELTVGELADLLSACDRHASVRLAVNPFFPMAHRLERITEATDETGRTVVYLAEGRDPDSQLGHLPPAVAVDLEWHAPAQPPRRARRSAARE
jgi:hypothetical protein